MQLFKPTPGEIYFTDGETSMFALYEGRTFSGDDEAGTSWRIYTSRPADRWCGGTPTDLTETEAIQATEDWVTQAMEERLRRSPSPRPR